MFNQKFKMDPVEYTVTPLNELIMVDLVPASMTCILGSSSSRLNRYCGFFSYSYEVCISYKHCAWIPHELAVGPPAFRNQDINACQPCTNLVLPQDTTVASNIQIGSVVVGTLFYEAAVTVKTPGTYKVMAATMQQGSMRIYIFQHSDFTRFLKEKRVVVTSSGQGGGLNITLNDLFDPLLFDET